MIQIDDSDGETSADKTKKVAAKAKVKQESGLETGIGQNVVAKAKVKKESGLENGHVGNKNASATENESKKARKNDPENPTKGEATRNRKTRKNRASKPINFKTKRAHKQRL